MRDNMIGALILGLGTGLGFEIENKDMQTAHKSNSFISDLETGYNSLKKDITTGYNDVKKDLYHSVIKPVQSIPKDVIKDESTVKHDFTTGINDVKKDFMKVFSW